MRVENGSRSVALIYSRESLAHDTGSHPESAGRVRAVVAALERRGIPEGSMLPAEAVDPGLLREVHSPDYISAVERAALSGGAYWDYDTYISRGSYLAAVHGAGAAAQAVDAVAGGDAASFAIVRPPGHHALYASAMGFCLFNNIAVAAQHAAKHHGLGRILIVDWDVHHGNGTQNFFYTRADVLFFSVHQYPFYPGTGALNEIGEGPGRGYNVNLPLPAGVGDSGYMAAFERVLAPVARRFRPELILISAGYDAHAQDPIGGMAVTVAGFHALTNIVTALASEIEECRGRVAAVLEGGYNVEALGESVVATVAALGSPVSQAEVAPGIEDRRVPNINPILEAARRLHSLE